VFASSPFFHWNCAPIVFIDMNMNPNEVDLVSFDDVRSELDMVLSNEYRALPEDWADFRTDNILVYYVCPIPTTRTFLRKILPKQKACSGP
jgi:hypothetical protein